MMTTTQVAALADGTRLPMLTIAEFFDGNTEEESLAPNQWGYGSTRPSITVIAKLLRELEASSDVAWVRVALHQDTELDESDGWISGDYVAICTTATEDDIAGRLDTDALESDGVILAHADWDKWVCRVPEIPEEHHLCFLIWD